MANKLTEQKTTVVKEIFDLFDINQNGTVPTNEIGVIMRSLGVHPTDDEITEMISSIDQEGTGVVDFENFCSILSNKLNDIDTEKEIQEALKAFDRDCNGYLHTTELRHLMVSIGEKLTEDEVNDMIAEADPNDSGKVNYMEFATKITKDAII